MDGRAADADLDARLGIVASDAPILIRATPYVPRAPQTIPLRPWIYDRRLCRGVFSVTVSAGGIGKSSLEMVEAIALATGRPLLGVPVPVRCRVWYYNLEDGFEELERRVAAILLHYNIDPSDLEGWLYLDSGRTSELILAETTRQGARIAQPVFDALEATLIAERIDCVLLDPLVSAHRLNENDNGAVDAVAKAINRLAERTQTAWSLVHHIRKTLAPIGGATVEDGRGAGALLAAARSARVLNQMTREEAERIGIENPRVHFRATNGKSNLAPPSERSQWYRLQSISLGNGPPGILDLSDHVAVVEPWEWPDPLADVTVNHLREVQRIIAADGPWRASVQSPQWAGRAVARAMGLDPDLAKDRTQIKASLKAWLASGMLKEIAMKDDSHKPRPTIIVGEWATD